MVQKRQRSYSVQGGYDDLFVEQKSNWDDITIDPGMLNGAEKENEENEEKRYMHSEENRNEKEQEKRMMKEEKEKHIHHYHHHQHLHVHEWDLPEHPKGGVVRPDRDLVEEQSP